MGKLFVAPFPPRAVGGYESAMRDSIFRAGPLSRVKRDQRSREASRGTEGWRLATGHRRFYSLAELRQMADSRKLHDVWGKMPWEIAV